MFELVGIDFLLFGVRRVPPLLSIGFVRVFVRVA